MPDINLPSRHDVELALRELEIEDEREKESIRRYWNLQRELARKPGVFDSYWPMFLFWVLFTLGLIALAYWVLSSVKFPGE